MNRSIVWLPLAALLLAQGVSRGDELDDIRQLWRDGSYSDVLTRAARLRDDYFGRSPELDYFIGTSACKTGRKELGIQYLTWCAAYPSLTDSARSSVAKARDKCGEPEAPTVIHFLAGTSGQVGVQARLKTYAGLRTNAVLRTELIATVRPVTAEELLARRVPVASPERGMARATELAGTNYSAKVFGRFVVVGKQGTFDESTGKLLETYEKFFQEEFSLALPPFMTTVYLAPTLTDLHALGAKLHGFKLPYDCIGYSHQDDVSLVVLRADMGNDGTICHELFHLMARSKFGDIPAWLDEGMAALYEASAYRDGRIVGLENWRRTVLKSRSRNNLPALTNLLQMSPKEFTDSNPDQQAVNEAVARYFLFYLQEEDLLAKVFKAFRSATPDQLPISDLIDPKKAVGRLALSTLETALGKPVPKVDEEFREWLFNP